MSVKWTVSNMKKWYSKHANDLDRRMMGTFAEELRSAMMSINPREGCDYISKWYALLRIYYEQEEKQTEENKLLLELLQANSDAIRDDNRLAFDIIQQMEKFFIACAPITKTRKLRKASP